ncbi:MAG TPA: N-acetylglucosamine-6-phosphate deacetylase, partial [Thermoanaerobaculia bacterium]|nr:N-acetylglucosamine-6-phosphate deacetylase [Thermoanaerobaculia bacterium]
DADWSAGDGLLVPAFVDVHVHGGAGHDFMDASEEAVEGVTRFHARNGTGSLLATTLSASGEEITSAIANIGRVKDPPREGCAEIIGIHLEGPYLAPARAGAQKPEALRDPDPAEVEAWLAAAPECRFLMTLAPERPGALALIRQFRDRVTFSIGHTSASFLEAEEAVETGARHFTHLFNAMSPLHHRDPGVVGAALLAQEATAELIADGVHLHPATLRLAAASLGDRAVLVTDAIRAAGAPEGTFRLLDRDVVVRDGAVRLSDGTLAGSVLTMIDAVRNMVKLAGLRLEIVLPLATHVPAGVAGAGERKGSLRIGFDADLLILSPELTIRRCFLRGEEVAPG